MGHEHRAACCLALTSARMGRSAPSPRGIVPLSSGKKSQDTHHRVTFLYCDAGKGFGEQRTVLVSKGPSALPCLLSAYLAYNLQMQERSLQEEVVQKRMSRDILSSPLSTVNREMLQCIRNQVCLPWHEASSHSVFLRKGTCCFVTSICGSSSEASRHTVRSAAGKNKYAVASVTETLGILKCLP